MDVFRTALVTAAEVENARTVAATYEGGQGMFTTGCSSTGLTPASHYISSGYLALELAEALTMANVSEEPAFDVLAESGLQLISIGEE